jgi:hypothetical protein
MRLAREAVSCRRSVMPVLGSQPGHQSIWSCRSTKGKKPLFEQLFGQVVQFPVSLTTSFQESQIG